MSGSSRRSSSTVSLNDEVKTAKKRRVDAAGIEDDIDDDSWRKLNVVQRHDHLFRTGHLSDCTFLVGAPNDKNNEPVEIHAHKLMLSHNSQVFEAMFYSDLAEKGAIKIEDINPIPFRKMLQYIYTDYINFECVETAIGVCYAAKKYMLSTLFSKSLGFIYRGLASHDVCKTLEFSLLISNKELETRSIQKLIEKTEKVLTADSFVDAELTTVKTLLEQDELDVLSEVSLFSACLRWAKPRVTLQSNLRQTLDPVLNLIRFRAMTPKEFAEIVCNTKVLTEKEEHNIFMCIASATAKMPLGLSQISDARERPDERETIRFLFLQPDQKYGPMCPSITIETNIFPNADVTNIFVRGVQLKSRSESDYEENVKIELCDFKRGLITASVTYKGKVKGSTDFNVFFNKPYPLLNSYDRYSSTAHQKFYVTYYNTTDQDKIYMLMTPTYKSKFGTRLTVSGYTTISGLHLFKRKEIKSEMIFPDDDCNVYN